MRWRLGGPDPLDGTSSIELADGRARVLLDDRGVRGLCRALEPKRGAYRIEGLPGVTFEVVPSEIKDQKGQVIETVG